MSINQLHGKSFEDVVKASENFRSSADGGRSNTAGFDIEAKFDRSNAVQLPTNIKTCKHNDTGYSGVMLSDARRFWLINKDYRFIIGCWQQIDKVKSFFRVYEIIMTVEGQAKMLGSLPLHEVASFHDTLTSFPAGKEGQKQAQLFHKEKRKELYSKFDTCIKLEPKVDSKTQRRLQASVSICVLKGFASEFHVHDEAYSNILLPFRLISAPRKFYS